MNRLLGSHDDVLVVGQDKDGLGRDALDGGKDVLGGGVHGLTAGDDSVSGQVGEDRLQALTGGDSNEAIVAAGVNGSVDELAGGVGFFSAEACFSRLLPCFWRPGTARAYSRS